MEHGLYLLISLVNKIPKSLGCLLLLNGLPAYPSFHYSHAGQLALPEVCQVCPHLRPLVFALPYASRFFPNILFISKRLSQTTLSKRAPQSLFSVDSLCSVFLLDSYQSDITFVLLVDVLFNFYSLSEEHVSPVKVRNLTVFFTSASLVINSTLGIWKFRKYAN